MGEGYHQEKSVNLKVLVPSVTVIALLVAVTVIGAIIVVTRAYTIRKERARGTDAERIVGQQNRHIKSSRDPRLPRAPECAHATRYNEKIRGSPWREWRSSRKKTLASSPQSNGEETVANDWRIDGDVGAVGKNTKNEKIGVVVNSNPILRVSDRLEMTEVVEGSLRKLEHLTGSKVVPSPRNPPNVADPTRALQTRTVQEIGREVDEIEISPSDTTPNSGSFATVLNPLTAPPNAVSYQNIADLRRMSQEVPLSSKRVSFTLPNNITPRHIATQYNPIRQHRLTFNAQSPPVTRPMSYSSGAPYQHRHTKTLPAPPPLQTNYDGIATADASTRAQHHRRSWSGRSVLELDQSPQDDSRRDIAARRKPVPPPPAPRKPAHEADVLTAHSLTVPRQSFRAPPPDTTPSQFTLGVHRSTSDSQSSVMSEPSSISSFGAAQPSPVLSGLSATPIPRVYSYPPPKRTDSDGAGPSGHNSKRYSAGSRSVADTILTEDTTTTDMTEKEIQSEMEKIRERAKRASIERKLKRSQMERLAAEKYAESRRRSGGPSSGQQYGGGSGYSYM